MNMQWSPKVREAENKAAWAVFSFRIVLDKFRRTHYFTNFFYTNSTLDALVRCMLRKFKLASLYLGTNLFDNIRSGTAHVTFDRL